MYHQRLGTKSPSPGIYIQDIEGYCLTEDEWNKAVGLTPNGIAVVTSNLSFVLAISEVSSSMAICGDAYTYPDLPQYSTDYEAFQDLNGANNTERMIAVYGSNANYAAGACANYVFPNGKRGYLGSAGEWRAIDLNYVSIAGLLSIIGGGLPYNNYNYTSTRGQNFESGELKFWFYNWSTHSWGCGNPMNKGRVRAFCSL